MENMFFSSTRGGQPQKSGISKCFVVGSLNLCLKKPDFAVSGQHQNSPIRMHILDVFSGQGDRIELNTFSLSQTS